jgi:uncharacterized protein YcbK (DUF882 family)
MPLTAARLSPHFRLVEFACHDGTPVPAECVGLLRDELVGQVLEHLREHFGSCHVLSGYRHARYNASIGGARDSRHIYRPDARRGLAADVWFPQGGVSDWAAAADYRLRQLGWGGGVGVYARQRFVHIDTRRVHARWTG